MSGGQVGWLRRRGTETARFGIERVPGPPCPLGRHRLMDAARLSRVKEAIAGASESDPLSYPQRVCSAAVDLLGVTGAALSLMTNSRLGAVWASDPVAARLEDIQLTLGEGPTMDALRWTSPAIEPHLAAVSTRWPFFRSPALDLGVGAVLAFPLQVGVIRLG